MLDGKADLGVHSAKDLPGERPGAIRLVGAWSGERNPLDAAHWRGHVARRSGPPGPGWEPPAFAAVRSSLLLRPDLEEPTDVHGNVDTRRGSCLSGDYDWGLVLASAGLRRLGRESEIAFRFGIQELTPAAGQGSLAPGPPGGHRGGTEGRRGSQRPRRTGRADRRAGRRSGSRRELPHARRHLRSARATVDWRSSDTPAFRTGRSGARPCGRGS